MRKIRILLVLGILSLPVPAMAICSGSIFNPVTDICWECMYPIKVMGGDVIGGEDDVPGPGDGSAMCQCGTIGIPVSYWEPSHILETTANAFCSPTLGMSMGNPFNVGNGSTDVQKGDNVDKTTYAQVHVIALPLDKILEGYLSGSCANSDGSLFDMLYVSEPDPTHADDTLAGIMSPETLLFANPVASISCVADSVGANAGHPLDPLFWCMGSWGLAYPLNGRMPDERVESSNAGIAAKNIYKRGRTGLLMDRAIDICTPVHTPIWVKSHYRLFPAKPVRGYTFTPIGRSSLIWGQVINHPLSGNNFAWITYRKKACCAW